MMANMAASNDYFASTCGTLLERMINTVPKEVVLSDVIDPYPVKPWFLDLGLSPNGTMGLSGIVRVNSHPHRGYMPWSDHANQLRISGLGRSSLEFG